MALRLRKPPSVSEQRDARAVEYFFNEIYKLLSIAGSRTYNVPSISAGGKETFTITVAGAQADEEQTVIVGVPSTFNTDLVPWGFVSDDDEVTVVLYNPTGSPINPDEATYTVRVLP